MTPRLTALASLVFLGCVLYVYKILIVSSLRTPISAVQSSTVAIEDRLAVVVHDRSSSTSPDERADRRPTLGCAQGKLISHISRDPCYAAQDVNKCRCGRGEFQNRATYAIPLGERKPLTSAELDNEVIFTFIHINKAGGTTLKYHMWDFIRKEGYDAAGYGEVETFPRGEARNGVGSGKKWRKSPSSMTSDVTASDETKDDHAPEDDDDDDEGTEAQQRQISTKSSLNSHRVSPSGGSISMLSEGEMQPSFFSCGKPAARVPFDHHRCALRMVWGGESMGLCDMFPSRPCVYFLTLREPLERAVSKYNYVCVNGAEGRKQWRGEWKRAGRCPLSLLEFYRDPQWSATGRFFVERLTRSCDAGCGVEAASRNLLHPCVRYLLLDRLDDGLARLAKAFGDKAGAHIARGAAKHRLAKANAEEYPPRTLIQARNPNVTRELRGMLRDDIELYRIAVENYESQWERPLVSCNVY